MLSKRCSRCQDTKDVSEFFKHGSGYQAYCKPCKAIIHANWRKSPAGELAKTKRKEAKKHIAEHYKHRYGISLEEYQILEALAGGKCSICKKAPAKGKLFVDHCHTTKKIRGMLCRPCNLVLGFAGDNVHTLEEAIKYLESSFEL